MLPLRARVDLGAMAMNGYSAFPKPAALLEPHTPPVEGHLPATRWGGGSYPSAEKQSVYSTTLEVISTVVVPFQLLEDPMEVLLCERVNDLRLSLFHLLNYIITTVSELRE